MKTMIAKSVLALPLLAGALCVSGAANIVANTNARKGAAPVANTSAVMNLAGPNSTAYRLSARLKVMVNANSEVSVALLSATLKAVSSTNDA